MDVKRWLPPIYFLYILGVTFFALLFTRKDANFAIHRHEAKFKNTSERANLPDVKFRKASLFDDIDLAKFSELELQMLFKQTLLKGYLDQSAKFHVLPDAFLATNHKTLAIESIGVAMSATLDSIAAVVSFLDKSRGGVSLALFVPSAKQFASAIAAVKFLRMCNTHVQNQVNWHFVLPKGVHIQDEDLRMLRSVSDCSVKVEDFVRTHNLGSSLQKNGSWPESLARNVARRHCQNEWVTVLEAETPPFKDLRLPRFLAQVRCKRCVFLLPLYETSGQREAPKDKQALLEAVNRGEATAAVEGLDLWERGPPTQEIKSIALTKNVPLDKNIFFVATHEIPKFDERYLAKHSTWAKAAQVLEMQLAGFKLFVLDPLFLWRRRRAPSFQRDEEGQQIFAHHLRELSLVYDKYLPKLMATYPYHNPTVVQVCKAKQKTQIVSNLKDNPSFKYGLPPPGKLGFQL